jgi:hypothetical protein
MDMIGNKLAKLSNGVKIPMLGLGVFCSPAGEIT